MLAALALPASSGGSGATGAACAVPPIIANVKPEIAIEKAVGLICSSPLRVGSPGKTHEKHDSSAAELFTKDEARRNGANVAKLVEL